jgi:hypothetical protein
MAPQHSTAGGERSVRGPDWYESQRRGLGGEFVAEIEAAFGSLLPRFATSHHYYRGFRRVVVPFCVQAILQTGERLGDCISHSPCAP